MSDTKLGHGHILKVEMPGFLTDARWGVRGMEKSRIAWATRSCYLLGKAMGGEAFWGRDQKLSLGYAEF